MAAVNDLIQIGWSLYGASVRYAVNIHSPDNPNLRGAAVKTQPPPLPLSVPPHPTLVFEHFCLEKAKKKKKDQNPGKHLLLRFVLPLGVGDTAIKVDADY